MIQGFVLAHRGTEDVAAGELRSCGAADVAVCDCGVLFSCRDLPSLCIVAYQLRSALKVLWVLSQSDTIDVSNVDFTWAAGKSFAVRSDQDSVDEGDIGAVIVDMTGLKVSLSNPAVTFFVTQCGTKMLFGVDVTGIDLGRREYRVFLGPTSIKGTLAFSLLQCGGWKPGMSLLDPFCQSGAVVIEAALAARRMPVAFHLKQQLAFTKIVEQDVCSAIDKDVLPEEKLEVFAFDPHFKHISATQKNAKIAQVNKCLEYSRQDIDWLDVKLEKDSIDCIVTCLPAEKDLKKGDIQALFLRAKPVLKKTGTITILTQKRQQEIRDTAKEYVLKEQRTVWQGQSAFSVMVFTWKEK
ncbi:hypothetical protein HY490_03310 [Candidatus Woesearchaeota archaeon]|nr:hypothetical protein [Candidatus Woesearchaeota archaeon]